MRNNLYIQGINYSSIEKAIIIDNDKVNTLGIRYFKQLFLEFLVQQALQREIHMKESCGRVEANVELENARICLEQFIREAFVVADIPENIHAEQQFYQRNVKLFYLLVLWEKALCDRRNQEDLFLLVGDNKDLKAVVDHEISYELCGAALAYAACFISIVAMASSQYLLLTIVPVVLLLIGYMIFETRKPVDKMVDAHNSRVNHFFSTKWMSLSASHDKKNEEDGRMEDQIVLLSETDFSQEVTGRSGYSLFAINNKRQNNDPVGQGSREYNYQPLAYDNM